MNTQHIEEDLATPAAAGAAAAAEDLDAVVTTLTDAATAENVAQEDISPARIEALNRQETSKKQTPHDRNIPKKTPAAPRPQQNKRKNTLIMDPNESCRKKLFKVQRADGVSTIDISDEEHEHYTQSQNQEYAQKFHQSPICLDQPEPQEGIRYIAHDDSGISDEDITIAAAKLDDTVSLPELTEQKTAEDSNFEGNYAVLSLFHNVTNEINVEAFIKSKVFELMKDNVHEIKCQKTIGSDNTNPDIIKVFNVTWYGVKTFSIRVVQNVSKKLSINFGLNLYEGEKRMKIFVQDFEKFTHFITDILNTNSYPLNKTCELEESKISIKAERLQKDKALTIKNVRSPDIVLFLSEKARQKNRERDTRNDEIAIHIAVSELPMLLEAIENVKLIIDFNNDISEYKKLTLKKLLGSTNANDRSRISEQQYYEILVEKYHSIPNINDRVRPPFSVVFPIESEKHSDQPYSIDRYTNF